VTPAHAPLFTQRTIRAADMAGIDSSALGVQLATSGMVRDLKQGAKTAEMFANFGRRRVAWQTLSIHADLMRDGGIILTATADTEAI